MTKAEQMLDQWVNDPIPVYTVEGLAKSIDPRVRVEHFLYTQREHYVFSDGSKAIFAGNCLAIKS